MKPTNPSPTSPTSSTNSTSSTEITSVIQTTQTTINSAAWHACDIFRGVMDADRYKDYILVMLFLKYISDVWEEHREKITEKYENEPNRIRNKLARERFVLPEGTSFYDLYNARRENDIGDKINKALEKIESENTPKLTGVFRDIDFNSESELGQPKERNRRLILLLESFNVAQLNMRPSRISGDVIGNTYMYLIERFASDSGKKAGEFYTPHQISKLLAQLCNPQIGARICDPACGSGGLLIEAAKAVGDNNYALFGMEVNGGTWALCRMNMFIHHLDGARIEWCNTLTAPDLKAEDNQLMQFDNIVSNPPFSLDKWGAEEAEVDPYNRFWRGIPPKSKGDYAFISHMIESAKEKTGRIAVVVPHGVLFRGGSEGRIRTQLVKENLLDAVIGLPANLFYSTSIPVAILVFDRTREQGGENAHKTDVLFIDASKEYTAGKRQNTLEASQINHIVQAYRNRKEHKKFAHVVTRKEIEENDFNLNIPRYVDTFEDEPEIDIVGVQKEIHALEGELGQIQKEMTTIVKALEKNNAG